VSEGLAAWIGDFDSIKSSLMDLGMKRMLHRAHVKELQGREIEDGTSIVHRWMQENYAHSMLIGLRRILDDSKGSFSLVKLLNKLEKHHALFTCERYLHWSSAPSWRTELFRLGVLGWFYVAGVGGSSARSRRTLNGA